jgi:signal transduction histidine kinase
VDLRCEGEPRALAPGVDLAAYRVLQEALAGAASVTAGGRIAVTIAYGDSAVDLTVSDERPGGGGPDAATVAALRERVGLYGGTLRARRGPDGHGMLISTELPYSGAAA